MINRLKNNILNPKDKQKTFLTISLIILMAIASETTITFQSQSQKILWSLLAIIGFVLIMCKKHNKEIYKQYLIICLGAIPYLFACIYTIILCSLGLNNNMGIPLQSFTTSTYLLIDFMAVATLIYIYKTKAIDLVFYFISISFLLSICISISKYGIPSLVQSIFNSTENILERHDIGTAVVALVLYYAYNIFFLKDVSNSKKMKLIISFVIMVLCGKRSAFIAFIISFFAGLILLIFKNKRQFLSILLLLSTLVVIFLYVVLLKYNFIEYLTNTLGMNAFQVSNGRLFVWNWFNNMYSISVSYVGQGFQFIHRYMTLGLAENGTVYSIVNNFNYLHNSILQIYIELGFIGWWLFFGFYLILYPLVIKKTNGSKNFVFYTILIIMIVVNYMTDNTLTYPVFQLTCYTAIFCISKKHSNRDINKKG